MLSETERSHIKALCLCFTQHLRKNSTVPKNTVFPLSERENHSYVFLLVHDLLLGIQSYHGNLSLSLSFFSLLFSLSQPLCLFVFLSIYVPIPVCITCVYTYVTPRRWYIPIYPSCLNTYTSPRTTLFSSKSFLPLKVFHIFPVYFHCIWLTTENPVINLSGQKSVILEDRVIGFAHIFIWLCSICVSFMCLLYCFSMKVKYKEEYEKNKGKSMLEFVETPSYQASKEAQKMQSEVGPFVLSSTV